jgi:nucleotide-binding universal stress UspA family protein
VSRDLLLALVVLAAGLPAGWCAAVVSARRRRAALPAPARRILFPFTGTALSDRALDAALRLARADDAALVPVYLAPVPMALVLDAPQPRVCDRAFSVFEAVEQRAARCGVRVDARIEPGRTPRHALREAMRHERFDRIVVAAARGGGDGFGAEDVSWLLRNAPGEVLVLRAASAAPQHPLPQRPGIESDCV